MTSPIPSEPRTLRKLYHAPASAAVAIAIVVAAIAMTYAVQGTLFRFAPALIAVTVAYLLVAAGVVGLGKGLAFSVGLRRPELRFWIAAVLVGISAWYIGLRLVDAVHPPGHDVQALEHQIKLEPLVSSLVAFALMPAIAEELVFRGVLARSISRVSTVLAIVVATIAFSAYHLIPSQILGTLPFSLAATVIAVRSDSVWPSMLAHVLNNALVILLTRELLSPLDRALDGHPHGALASAIAIGLLGLGIAAKGVA